MLYDFETFRRTLSRSYVVEDVTVVIAVRIHDNNPWVLGRLACLANYYEPAPNVIIVDFGSSAKHRQDIEALCEAGQFQLVRVDDDGVFSLARARNVGAAIARTDLLFFSDIDCFGERDLFERIIRFANATELGTHFDEIVDLPVYHLSREVSQRFFSRDSHIERDRELSRAFAQSVLTANGTISEYVDPHSNFFLIRRDFFAYIGGFNENFRGHGSEDFEFLLRVALYSLRYPLPERPVEDLFSPKQRDFHDAKPFAGFRRLFELMAEPAQLAGLRIAHLHHPRSRDSSGWYESNDWSRTRFSEQTEPLLARRSSLLEYDWMPRTKTALVLVKQDAHADVFFPLRLLGYKLVVAYADQPDSVERGRLLITNHSLDAVAVFNPYMRSHAELLPLFELAKTRNIRTIVFERGALPESWYYAQDMSYADPDFVGLAPSEADFSSEELSLADAYVAKLREGSATLESNGDYLETLRRHENARAEFRHVCLLPLQLADDVAVVRFNAAHEPYDAMIQSLASVIAKHEDVLFVVKAHPLSKLSVVKSARNVVSCGQEDNIHALIELSDSVICYNSGVGLLALLHGKRLVTLGNAYYNLTGMGLRARTFAQAVSIAAAPRGDFLTRPVRPFLAWLLFRKYSFFRSESVLREFKHRVAHGYRNMLWYQLNLDGTRSTLRTALDARVAPRCYATARMGIGEELVTRGKRGYAWTELPSRSVRSERSRPAHGKLNKLVSSPRRFFADSAHAPLRLLSTRLPDRELTIARTFLKIVRNPLGFLQATRSAQTLGLSSASLPRGVQLRSKLTRIGR